MKKLLVFFIIAITGVGCHTRYICKHKAEICDNICPDKIVQITDTFTSVDIDTLYVSNGIDSLFFNAILSTNKPDTIYIHDNNFTGSFIITEKRFIAQISHLSDTIKVLRQQKNRVITKIEEKTVKVPNPIDAKLQARAKIRLIIIIVLASIILICAYFRVKKRWVKGLL